MNAVADEMEVLRQKKIAIHEKACVDRVEMGELSKEISRLAKAMGAITA